MNGLIELLASVDGLSALWPCGDTGDSLADAGPHGLHLTAAGAQAAAGLLPYSQDQASSFDGLTSAAVLVDAPEVLRLPGSLTVCCVAAVNVPRSGPQQYYAVAGCRQASPERGWELGLLWDGAATRLQMTVWGDAGMRQATSPDVPAGVHFLAGAWDDGAGVLSAAVDGQAYQIAAEPGATDQPSGAVSLGYRHDGAWLHAPVTLQAVSVHRVAMPAQTFAALHRASLYECRARPAEPAGVPVVLDTDCNTDVGDAGCLAAYHALADAGELSPEAVTVSVSHQTPPACVSAVNTFYGRGNAPVGRYDGTPPVSDVAHGWVPYVAQHYPHDPGPFLPATAVLRQTLAAAQDGSAVLVSVGSLANLDALLRSAGDSTDARDGTALAAAKVRQLCVMGGHFPVGGTEWNFALAPWATDYVLRNWPTEIVLHGFEVGVGILAGSVFAGMPDPHPIKDAYAVGGYPGGRDCWDELTLLQAVRGCGGGWAEFRGTCAADPQTGANTFTHGPGNHWYAVKMRPDAEYAKAVNGLHQPPDPEPAPIRYAGAVEVLVYPDRITVSGELAKEVNP